MNQKSIARTVVYLLAALMLLVNVTGVSASPGDQVKQSGNVFTVSPTGGDDTANIQQAFDRAKAAGSGSMVRLTAGNFHTRFIAVTDFDGTFKGAGQGVTVIDTFADQDCQAQVDRDQWPALFRFTHGYPRISDLSFHITPPNPCHPYLNTYFGPGWMDSFISVLLITASPWKAATDCEVIQKEMVSASVTRVTIEGEAGQRLNGETDPFFSNVLDAVWVGGTISTHAWDGICSFMSKFGQGVFRLTENTFRKVSGGVNPYGVYNSSVVISGNTFDTSGTPILDSDHSGSVNEISHNRLVNTFGLGIFIFQGGYPIRPLIQAASVFNIHDNEISAYEGGNGITAWDDDNLGSPYAGYPSTGKRLALIVRDNHFRLDPANVCGVWLEGVDDALILNNQFTGSSAQVVFAGSWGPTRRGIIAGNDLSKYTRADGSPYKIELEAGTDHYLVTGVPEAEVLDLGTNNLISNRHIPAGHQLSQAFKDEMSRKIEGLWRLFRGFHFPKH